MKQLAVLAFFAGLLTATGALAQTTATAAPDTAAYREYVGTYKMKEAQFETLVFTLEEGKLMGEATGQGKGQLMPEGKIPDTFTVPGYDATITFSRGTDRKVTKAKLTIQGQEFEGEKQP